MVVMGGHPPLWAPFYPICTFQEERKPSKLLDLLPSYEVGVRLRESGSQAYGCQGRVLWAGPQPGLAPWGRQVGREPSSLPQNTSL